MQDDLSADEANAYGAGTPDDEWLAQLEEISDERGYFEPLGVEHSAILTDEGRTLLVTFETVRSVRDTSPLQEPLGWTLVRQNGWSNLCVLAHSDSWFRDRAVYGYFDRLIEDGFFEEFEKVIFFGAGMCGYAAAAFSIVAPEVTVIAVQPQATLDPNRTEFDRRFPKARRRNFTDRYHYAPEMVEMAQDVFLFFDPAITEDTVHAAMFAGTHIHHIHCRHFGGDLPQALFDMGVTHDLIDQAGQNRLTPQSCYRALRVRRRYRPYLRRLLASAEARRKPLLVKWLATSVTTHQHAPRFQQALKRAEQALAERS
ncbi:phosphoadenosine phosphosulfate reductase [Aliiroseovarius sp. F47248L]|uniref:phosphoadenosine phosphosulfate reductase n=1 Tax=Aliiroseovarius sp. F47248L TaxID=2926420 RepID=UPI001FF5CEE8|nr:phosphoadenosine phosphosulfate reductase [Aliiroseovarius sp. F47248L]MCK0138198.1 phosphoadenosine phosphosulfate reductase [Aliiroseovarius sp. F47248L]